MRFALVVPALNEEGAIAGTLRRALAAREKVCSQTPVDELIIVFVNDGSTDRTQEIVDQPEFDEVVKVRFEKNRGYGAAIKAGWQATDAELVGFIDADGTCDPDFCVNLLNRFFEAEADVVLAGRLTPESKMPLIRKIGNIIFARLLGIVSGQRLTDSASGFRIVRRSSLKLMTPLPDGLHFTPAMSCICLLDRRLRIEEVPMPYEERIGRSKLSVVKDGLRFLYTILFSACCYAPLKTMLGASVIALTLVGLLGWLAALTGASAAGLWVLGLSGAMLALLMISTGLAVHELNFLLIGSLKREGAVERALEYLMYYKRLMLSGAVALGVGGLGLLIQAVASRGDSPAPAGGMALTASLLMLVALGMTGLLGGVIVRVIWAVSQKQRALIQDEYEVRPPESRNVDLPDTDRAGVAAEAQPQMGASA